MSGLKTGNKVKYFKRNKEYYGRIVRLTAKYAVIFNDDSWENTNVSVDKLEMIPPYYLTAEQVKKFIRFEEKWSVITEEADKHADVFFKEPYRMTTDDILTAMRNIKKHEYDSDTIYDEWYKHLYHYFYKYDEYYDGFGFGLEFEDEVIILEETPDDVEMVSFLPDRGDKIAEIIAWLNDIFEYSSDEFYKELDENISMLENYLEDEDKPIEERRYDDSEKTHFISSMDNDDKLKKATEKELEIYRKFVGELCEKDNITALRCLGYGCYGGNTAYECDWETSRNCMLKLYDLTGKPVYANTLGYIYYYGRCWNGEPHYEEAFKYFSIGAAGGYYESRYKLADMYIKGLYVKQNKDIAETILFELYNIQCTWNEQKGIEHNIRIADYWGYKKDEQGQNWLNENGIPERRYDVAKSLKVPIGFTENGGTTLDLHEHGDGPHMLVAGTTGSGKSETIISYILSLCMRFRPEELNLMLVDMKGGGFVKRVGDLPHIVGKVTDVDGDENGTGDEYMLRRFLDSLTAEIKRRKLKLNQMHVDNADSYIKACRDIEGHIKKLSRASQRGTDRDYEIPDADVLRNLAENEKLSHLILIVDEFTELKRFSSESNDIDFMKEISTIARVGRSLGIHIILVSQNTEGAINDEIRVNSKSKLCLKVATPQASKEMIGTDLAASPTMPGNGRAYLLVGTGTRFTYFQSAYSGSNAISSMEMPFKMIQAEKNGMYTEFYNSENDNEEMKKKKKELSNSGGTLTQCTVMMNAIIEEFERGNYFKPHIVFQTPLPSKVILQNGKPVILKN